ncbi:hypothetical protein [Granulosicoccus antarcticus]|uniref:Uncharacterized protein n=1 Tax=Granulosicoccus antarcticus IMCC3135 TaxID=1192854 RepID=A0A2Z2NMP2_9GAMM|nr:hypothetical protein [Granulosicoccus antarcticus]ASJ71231.1 hypothetical protein IMCC3135_05595 [Granulosicoccus antarcticus IMCC3135]
MKSQVEIVADAIDLVRPSIDLLFERTNRQELHIVVMNPRVKPWEATFEESILYETSLGQPEKWTIKFDQLARQKARQAWRNQCANINSQLVHPASLQEDDLLFFGSFVYGDIVVACSGVEQWYDMLISGWIAVAIEQLMMHEYQTIKSKAPGQQTFKDGQ